MNLHIFKSYTVAGTYTCYKIRIQNFKNVKNIIRNNNMIYQERDLSFAVDGDVRLDACIPPRLDASPDRLLEPSIWKASTSCRNS